MTWQRSINRLWSPVGLRPDGATRCACARDAPQDFHIDPCKIRRMHPSPTSPWFTRRLKKIAYENHRTVVHVQCNQLLFSQTLFDFKKSVSHSISHQTFRKDSSCRIDQRVQVSTRAGREPLAKAACTMMHRMYIRAWWPSAMLQSCMKSAKPDEPDSRARATGHRVGDHKFHNPADRSASTFSRSEQWSVGASCQLTARYCACARKRLSSGLVDIAPAWAAWSCAVSTESAPSSRSRAWVR